MQDAAQGSFQSLVVMAALLSVQLVPAFEGQLAYGLRPRVLASLVDRDCRRRKPGIGEGADRDEDDIQAWLTGSIKH